MPNPEAQKLQGQIRHAIGAVGGLLVGLGIAQTDSINMVMENYDKFSGFIAYGIAAYWSWKTK